MDKAEKPIDATLAESGSGRLAKPEKIADEPSSEAYCVPRRLGPRVEMKRGYGDGRAFYDAPTMCVCKEHIADADGRIGVFWPDNREISHVEYSYMRIVQDFRDMLDDKILHSDYSFN